MNFLAVRKVLIVCLLFVLPGLCLGAQQRRKKTTTKPKPAAAAPAPKPSTLLGCGVSLRVPPGWELSVAKKREIDEAQVTPTTPTSDTANDSDSSPAPPAKTAEPIPMPPCSFVLAPKAPSELVKNTDTEGPIGEMELRVVDGDLDTAAANIFQKDDKGWYATGPKDTRVDAKLTRQKTTQILTSVIVQSCFDKSGKLRGLCESSRYVYSNGKKNLLVTAGPYLGETEYSVLNSIRFVGAATTRARKR